MRIEITGRHLEVTDPIRAYAEEKCGKLTRYFNGVMEIQLVLTQQPHQQEFEAELQIDVQKHDDLIAKTHSEDIYECIDLTVDKAARQLRDYKEKLKSAKR